MRRSKLPKDFLQKESQPKERKPYSSWRHEEAKLQAAIIQYADLVLVPKGFDVIYTPNEGKRSWVQGAIRKKMGLRAGFPDIKILPNISKHPNMVVGFMENKVGRGKLSDKQEQWRDRLIAKGYHWAEIRSFEDFIEAIKKWGYIE